MNAPDTPSTEATPSTAASPVDAPTQLAPGGGAGSSPPPRPVGLWPLVMLGVLCIIALVLVWTTQQRVRLLEQELVRRQQDSQDQSAEARMLARQARDASTEMVTKLALLEGRVAETALQRSQVEELIQSMSRSRDENVLADVEAAVRVAQQQSAITGSVEPLVSALRQADERLGRYDQPRLARVRQAVARDLDKARAVALADLPTLSARLDELMRQVDNLPLWSVPTKPAPPEPRGRPAPRAASAPATGPASMPMASNDTEDWRAWLQDRGVRWGTELRDELRALLRVTRIEHPEAMLIAPDQAFFLRENLKLRLLNARLAVLSRQFELAQTDLSQARDVLERYFDRNSRRVSATLEQINQIAAQVRQVPLPRPDDTLAALAAAAAGR